MGLLIGMVVIIGVGWVWLPALSRLLGLPAPTLSVALLGAVMVLVWFMGRGMDRAQDG